MEMLGIKITKTLIFAWNGPRTKKWLSATWAEPGCALVMGELVFVIISLIGSSSTLAQRGSPTRGSAWEDTFKTGNTVSTPRVGLHFISSSSLFSGDHLYPLPPTRVGSLLDW
ncbi:hypothetical protein TorRG33x02_200330 [Trema orientale]|uniref:Uncharacterized protein n=1 Tax=Trema orientale TaxID=63057 RepID=A0A2P5EF10_TREOI|nr:hypothetical protein TorRG33x02_200330 [Trema orientale]